MEELPSCCGLTVTLELQVDVEISVFRLTQAGRHRLSSAIDCSSGLLV